MKEMKQQFISSWQELRNIQSLVITAMLIAVGVVLGFYFTIQVTQFIKIGFSFLANELMAVMFGPIVGSLGAGITDILKYLVKPTGPFFPGFTISAIVGGIIYGILLYKKKITFIRVLSAKVSVSILVNLFLNTYWLTMLYGDSFWAILPARALKQVAMVPIETILFFLVVKVLQEAKIFALLNKQ